MRLRAWVAAGASAVVAGGAVAASEIAQAPGAPARAASSQSPGAAKRRLPAARHVRPRAFASCAGLVRYARAHFAVTHGVPDPSLRPVVQPALGAPVAQSSPTASAPAAAAPAEGTATGTGTPAYSTTNVQEAGVDEPDIVKTDGSTIFTVSQSRLFAVAAGAGGPKLEGTLDLGRAGYSAQLLLRGTRLIVILSATPVVPVALGAPAVPAAAGARPAVASVRPAVAGARTAVAAPAPAINVPSPYYYRASTTVEEVDVSDPAAMRVTRTMTVDGTFVDARQNGSTARLVIASAPPTISDPRLAATASGWVPRRRFHSLLTGHRYNRPAASCAAIARPAQFSGLGMLTILTLNLDRGLWTAGSDALMADAQVVYGSTQSLYVATQKWIPPQTAPDRAPPDATVIDRFDVSDPSQTTLVASGEVPGYLLNQFSLSEYKGFLRVASTSRPIWWTSAPPPPSQSYVTVLSTQGAALVPVGQVAGLGVGQQIYSVRFVDDAGYVVTFRRVDPLYTLDLSTATAPKVAGQLELEGYSSYLHPVGSGLLLGVGQSIGASANEPSGAQLELFDVSDPAAPKLLARAALGSGSSTNVSYDHHAFLFWPPTKLAVLPLQIYPPPTCSPQPGGPPQPVAPNQPSGEPNLAPPCPAGSPQPGFTGAIGYSIDRSGITEVGRVVHDAVNGYAPPVLRSIVIGDRLFTVSDAGVMASQLATLARQTFVAFPQPQPQTQPGVSGSGTAPPGTKTTVKPAGR